VASWVRVADESSLRTRMGVEWEGHRLALFRMPDGIYALDDVCSHEYSLLSEGEIWEDDVYCPKHGSRFDIRTGEVRSLPAVSPVKTYPVRVEDGGIFVQWPG
jgi:3-phenylpropionate/trans-cinnamate dioxygenase ferredoxin subunit